MSALGQKTFALAHVRFTPQGGHMQCTRPCLLWAKSGHDDINRKAASGGLSESGISILIRRLLALSVFQAGRLGGKAQCSSTQALSIAFAACCAFEDAFGQSCLLHRSLPFRRKAGPGVVKSLSQKGDGFRIKIHGFPADHLSPHVLFRLTAIA